MSRAFEDKIVFITGGASGIGKATALAFAEKGAGVVVADLMTNAGQEATKEIERTGTEALFVQMDVADAGSVERGFAKALAHFGRVDIAFNNAGLGGMEAATRDYPEDNWEQVIAVNLTGVFYCMKNQLAHMVERKAGIIINMASVAGVQGFPWHSAYAASKHGVVGLTKSAAYEVAREGVRVNAICPGFTETPMVAQMVEKQPERKKKLERSVPLGRLAQPEEIASGVLFLASEENKFMIGHTLVLDGGISSV